MPLPKRKAVHGRKESQKLREARESAEAIAGSPQTRGRSPKGRSSARSSSGSRAPPAKVSKNKIPVSKKGSPKAAEKKRKEPEPPKRSQGRETRGSRDAAGSRGTSNRRATLPAKKGGSHTMAGKAPGRKRRREDDDEEETDTGEDQPVVRSASKRVGKHVASPASSKGGKAEAMSKGKSSTRNSKDQDEQQEQEQKAQDKKGKGKGKGDSDEKDDAQSKGPSVKKPRLSSHTDDQEQKLDEGKGAKVEAKERPGKEVKTPDKTVRGPRGSARSKDKNEGDVASSPSKSKSSKADEAAGAEAAKDGKHSRAHNMPRISIMQAGCNVHVHYILHMCLHLLCCARARSRSISCISCLVRGQGIV